MDPAPQTVCASATCTNGLASATCVFPSAGTWFLFAKAFGPDSTQSVTLPLTATVLVSAYTDPASVTLTTTSAYVAVPTSILLSIPALEGTRRAITVHYDASASAANPTQCGTGDMYDGSVTVTCTFPTAGTFYVYVRVTSPITGTATAPIRATATISVTAAHSAKWIKLAQTYTGTWMIANAADRTYSADSSTLSVAAASSTQNIMFADFLDQAIFGDFVVILKFTNMPRCILTVVSSPAASTNDLSMFKNKTNTGNYYNWSFEAPYVGSETGFASVGSISTYSLIAGYTGAGAAFTLDYKAIASPLAISGSSDGTGQQRYGSDTAGTVYFRFARTGTAFQVSMSSDGATWSTSPAASLVTAAGFGSCSLNATTIPATDGVLIGCGVYGAPNAARPAFQMQVSSPLAFPSAATVSPVAAVATVPVTLTLTATGYDTANSSTCSLYYVVGKTYTLLGTGILATNGRAAVTCTFPVAGAYKLAFTVTNRAGVQSGYIPTTTVAVSSRP